MQGRQTRQRTVDSPFRAKGVTTFDSYRSDLHRAAPNTCPGAPCVLWAGTVPRAGESLLCSLHGERGTLGRWGRRILAALAPAAAAELRLNPSPRLTQKSISQALGTLLVTCPGSQASRAQGRRFAVAWRVPRAPVRFSRGLFWSLTGSRWARNSESICTKSCLNPRLAVIYLLLGLPSPCPKTTRKQ